MLLLTTKLTPILSKSIVIEINGDCATIGKQVAHEHGYRFVRQVEFQSDVFCRITSLMEFI